MNTKHIQFEKELQLKILRSEKLRSRTQANTLQPDSLSKEYESGFGSPIMESISSYNRRIVPTGVWRFTRL